MSDITSRKSFWSISFGNVVSWGMIIFTFVAMGQRVIDKVDHLSERVDVQGKDLDALTRQGLVATLAQHDRRLVELEGALRSITELTTDVKWIKRRLNETDKE